MDLTEAASDATRGADTGRHTGTGARLARVWRVTASGLCFLVFGAGGVVLRMLVFPLLALVLRHEARKRNAAQAIIHAAFAALVGILSRCGVIRCEIRGAEKLRRDGLLILANHPTLLDVILLMALVRRADCIVKGALVRNPFTRGPIQAAGYVCNDSGSGLVEDCIASVRAGNNLIIFPEGTRTPRRPEAQASDNTHGVARPRLQRGAAQIAVRGRLNITPVRIHCAPLMLVKGEPWWRMPAQPSHFTLEVGDDIAVQPFLDTPQPRGEANAGEALAARRLTEFLSSYFFQESPRATT
ncbi:1-acyl-sn-glycerol-3-phosphate acyltransferase [Hylemonella gracilis]|uniref:1-acyl-sn-glycerol-3-phosphate acyltransferase n=2 Tax=Hylemonella gracilis TaxID=80880 RepID=A0A4P6UQQ5_9BURK|nr:1-acyl-sn-glycerol-3-phosphate acyltransferase [Hylemonella gracilis]